MKFIDPHKDVWHAMGGEDGPAAYINPSPYLLLTLEQWHAFRASWPTDMPVGVKLDNTVDVSILADDLARLSLVTLQFPKWVDGRAYSQAHTLRARYRFKGEIRACGEVLVDMVLLLKRTGFDAAQLRLDQSVDEAYKALSFFPGYYQGDTTDPLPLFAKPTGTAETLARAQAESFNNAGASI